MSFKTILQEPCTWWFNHLWGWRDWSHCCEAHDKGYGNCELDYDRYAYRLMHDEELRDCVNKILPGMGTFMFWGVRIFGRFFM